MTVACVTVDIVLAAGEDRFPTVVDDFVKIAMCASPSRSCEASSRRPTGTSWTRSSISPGPWASPTSGASALLRHFRHDTGKTPHAYIKIRRLEEARRLIAAGRNPIGDVASLVGYENFGSFSTAFKKHFGASPSSFRKTRRR